MKFKEESLIAIIFDWKDIILKNHKINDPKLSIIWGCAYHNWMSHLLLVCVTNSGRNHKFCTGELDPIHLQTSAHYLIYYHYSLPKITPLLCFSIQSQGKYKSQFFMLRYTSNLLKTDKPLLKMNLSILKTCLFVLNPAAKVLFESWSYEKCSYCSV